MRQDSVSGGWRGCRRGKWIDRSSIIHHDVNGEGKFNHSSQKLTIRRIVLAKGMHSVLWSMYNIVKYIR